MNNELARLHRFILEQYDLEELQTLCFELHVSYDDLRGEGISGKVRELLLSLGSRRQYEPLLDYLGRTRPEPFRQAGFGTDPETAKKLYQNLPSFETKDEPGAKTRWPLILGLMGIGCLLVAVVAIGLYALGPGASGSGSELSDSQRPPTSTSDHLALEPETEESIPEPTDGQPPPTITAEPSATNTPPATFTLTAVESPTEDIAPLTRVVASRPTENELSAIDSLWNLTSTGYRDMQEPGTQAYELLVSPTDSWRWTFAWCAKDRLLLETILEPLTLDFFIDGIPVSSAQIRQHEGSTSPGWQCQFWSTILRDWTPQEQIDLEIRYNLTESIYDGSEDYSPGEYQQLLLVRVSQ